LRFDSSIIKNQYAMQNYKDLKVWEKAHELHSGYIRSPNFFPKKSFTAWPVNSKKQHPYQPTLRRVWRKITNRIGAFFKYFPGLCKWSRIFFDPFQGSQLYRQPGIWRIIGYY